MTEMAPRARLAWRPPQSSGLAQAAPGLVALVAFFFLAAASTLMLQRVWPFVNWYYITAWYPTIVMLDCAVAVRSGRFFLLSRPAFAISLFAWSAVLWFFFELMNFRIQNWYYVFLPPDRPIRWAGTTLAFMTVLPAIFLAEHWLAGRKGGRGTFGTLRWPTFEVTPRLLRHVFLTGVAFVAATLLWPRVFFPLVWGGLTLLLEPWNYRRDPGRSLLGDLADGRPARILRLLLGGVAIGFLWELFNIEARSKWIYTVPGFENFKLFEMPLLGFFGFPVFALDCFVIYQSLVIAGVAVSPSAVRGAAFKLRPARVIPAVLAAVVFCLAALLGMDHWNTDSLRPRLSGLWVMDAQEIRQLARTPYGDVFVLAAASPREVAEAAGASHATARTWVDAARLATFRGIGNENGRLLWEAGVTSVADLAAADPESLSAQLRKMASQSRVAATPKVRVWVRAARSAISEAGFSLGAS